MNRVEEIKNDIEYRKEQIEIQQELIAELEDELKKLNEERRFYIGEEFLGKYKLVLAGFNTPRILKMENWCDKAGDLKFYIEVITDECGKKYVKTLPTIFPDDLGLDFKYAAKEEGTLRE